MCCILLWMAGFNSVRFLSSFSWTNRAIWAGHPDVTSTLLEFLFTGVRPINDLPVHCDNTATRNLVVWEGITVLEDHSYILTVRVREHGNVKYINTMPDTTITEVDNIDTIDTDDTTSSTITSPGSYGESRPSLTTSMHVSHLCNEKHDKGNRRSPFCDDFTLGS
ncbi:hypothetical protein Bbelb_052140 [Branchiostoma belcheri]|nr:hypothetical protein Bbelb_052140 [Branchiostoma belcheri]